MADLERELEEARRALEGAREDLARARVRVKESAAGGDEAAITAAIQARDAADLRAEVAEERVEAIEDRIDEAEQAEALEKHRAGIREKLARLTGWKSEYLRTCEEADGLMAELAATLDRRAAILGEISALDPRRLREIHRMVQPVWLVRAAVTADLFRHFGAQHPWGSQRATLAEDEGQLRSEGVDSLIGELRQELAEPAAEPVEAA